MLSFLSCGTYKLTPNECTDLTKFALDTGYTSFDTAVLYKNQTELNQNVVGLKNIFVTTKIHNKDQLNIKNATREICQEINPNLLLLHSPVAGKYVDAWNELGQCYQDYDIKYIGVSNFGIEHLNNIMVSGQKPYLNQIELHPWNYNYQKNLLLFCQENEIIVQAHTPCKIWSQKYKAGETDLTFSDLLSWYKQINVPIVIGSKSKENIKTNYDAFLKIAPGVCNKFELYYNENLFLFPKFKF